MRPPCRRAGAAAGLATPQPPHVRPRDVATRARRTSAPPARPSRAPRCRRRTQTSATALPGSESESRTTRHRLPGSGSRPSAAPHVESEPVTEPPARVERGGPDRDRGAGAPCRTGNVPRRAKRWPRPSTRRRRSLRRAFSNVFLPDSTTRRRRTSAGRPRPVRQVRAGVRTWAGTIATTSAIAASTSRPVRRPNRPDNMPTRGGPATMPT